MMAFFDTKSLFGTTPEEMQRELFDQSQAKRQKEIEFLAKQSQTPGYMYGMLQSIEPLRQAFANQGEDPRVTQLRQREAAAKKALAGADITTAEGKQDLLNRLVQAGLYEQAYKMGLIFKNQAGKRATPQKIKTQIDGKNVVAFVDPVSGEVVKTFPAPRGELSSSMEKELFRTQNIAMTAEESVGNIEQLVTEIEANPWSGGIPANISEGIKGATGGRDLMSYIKMKVTELSTEKALGKLPPGAASDIDVANAFKTVPNANSSSAYILRWLKDIQRIDRRRAAFNSFKADYISNSESGNTSGMLKAWKKFQSENQPAPTQATTAPAQAPAAQTQPTPLMPNYEEKGFSIKGVR